MTATTQPPITALALVRNLQDETLPTPSRRREIRERAGATLQEVGDALNVSPQCVWRWENRPPRRLRRKHALAYRQLLDALAEIGDRNSPSLQE